MVEFGMNLNKILTVLSRNIALFLFLCSIFLLKLYPFYFIPINFTLFSTYTLAKILIFLVSTYFIFVKYDAITQLVKGNKVAFVLLFLYFFGQSISVLGAKDLLIFLKFYHNVIISILIFTLSFLLASKKKMFPIFFFFSLFLGALLVLLEAVFRSSIDFSLPLLTMILQKDIADTLVTNVSNGKYVLVYASEMFLPFFITAVADKKINKSLKLFATGVLIALFFLSWLSNFRTRFVMLAFAAISSLIIYGWSRKNKAMFAFTLKKITQLFFLITLVGTVLYSALILSNGVNFYNILDRLTLQNRYEDKGPLEVRLAQYKLSTQLLTISPLFGIGLGNFSDYLYYLDFNHVVLNITPGIEESEKNFIKLSTARPHNILFQLIGETGLIGTSTFLILVLYFCIIDYRLLKYKEKNHQVIPFIVSSWTVIVYSLFNPADTIFILGWFWFARGAIQSQSQYIHQKQN